MPIGNSYTNRPITTTDEVVGFDSSGVTKNFTFGSMASQDASNVTITGGSITGVSIGGVNLSQSTGVYSGGVLSVGTPNTTFSISDGRGVVTDSTVYPPVVTEVTWTGKTNIAATYLATNLVSYIAIDSSGNVIQSATPFTFSQHRTYITLGSLIHVNLTNLDAVNNFQDIITNPTNHLSDLTDALHVFNESGNVFSANGANLNINKSLGYIYSTGSNWANDATNPSIVTLNALTALTFQYRFQGGTNGATGTAIDPNIYDVGGVSTATPANKFTIQRIYSFVSNNVKIQPGQNVYNTLAEAKAAIQIESFVTEPSIAQNGLLRGFLVVKQGTTDLTDSSKAFFLDAGKFGQTSGVGGLSVSTMQNTYNNSDTPEIVTDSTRGAVSLKRGSAADTNNVLEVQNGAGTNTFTVTGNGVVSTGTWNATTVAVGYGGTGQTSYTDGQLLIGNTTGNTLTKATLTGTADQVTVTNGSGSITLSLPQSINTTSTPTFGGATISGGTLSATGVVDFGGASSFEIPSGTTPTTDAAGEMALDTNGNGSTITTGVVQVYDGTRNLYLVGATNYPSTDNDVPAYDSATNSVTWQAQAGAAAGGWSFVETVSPSAAASADFTSSIDTNGWAYRIIGYDIDLSATAELRIQVYNGSVWRTADYFYAARTYDSAGAENVSGSAAAVGVQVSNTTIGGNIHKLDFTVTNPAATGTNTSMQGNISFDTNRAGHFHGYYSGTAEAHSQIRVIPASGTITGTFKMYKLAVS